MLLAVGCKSTSQKRINKDIIGINEQLYDLEKNQIKMGNRLKKLETDMGTIQTQPQEEKDKENKVNDLERIYKEGYQFYLEQNFTEAIKQFSLLTDRFKNDSLIDNALYWQAESFLKQNKTDQALSNYQALYRYFPFSNRADHALYKIGIIYSEREDSNKALLAFERLTRDYPDSELKNSALLKIKQLNQTQKNRRKK